MKKVKSEKQILRENKKAQKETKKTIQSTLDWLHIQNVHEYHVELQYGKKQEIMMGVKIKPHTLFLENKAEQKRRIHLYRSALNRMNFDIWHGFVFNPVNLDSYLLNLVRQMMIESDVVIKEMLQDDIDKANAFVQQYRELEFFLMIKGKEGKKLEDQYRQLQSGLASAGFEYKPLTRLDFDNFIAYSMENTLINDYYFSRGVFEVEGEAQ